MHQVNFKDLVGQHSILLACCGESNGFYKALSINITVFSDRAPKVVYTTHTNEGYTCEYKSLDLAMNDYNAR